MVECDHCHGGTRRAVHTYWRHVYCPRCAQTVAAYLDRYDIWPVPPWEFKRRRPVAA